ncbi:MAG TPA: hypothetical protein VFZ04_05715 [Longimicrobiales bacterium]
MAGIGAVLVIGALGALVMDGTKNEIAAPAITLEVDTIIPTGANYVVKVRAKNSGGETAAAVVIEGVLAQLNGAQVERSELVLDYLPRRSSRTVGLIYRNDPRALSLSLRAVGYQTP